MVTYCQCVSRCYMLQYESIMYTETRVFEMNTNDSQKSAKVHKKDLTEENMID